MPRRSTTSPRPRPVPGKASGRAVSPVLPTGSGPGTGDQPAPVLRRRSESARNPSTETGRSCSAGCRTRSGTCRERSDESGGVASTAPPAAGTNSHVTTCTLAGNASQRTIAVCTRLRDQVRAQAANASTNALSRTPSVVRTYSTRGGLASRTSRRRTPPRSSSVSRWASVPGGISPSACLNSPKRVQPWCDA